VGEAFGRAIALDPKNAEAWHQFGWILAIQGDDTGAVAAFRRALAIEPERAVTWLHIAAVAVAGRHYADAAHYLDSAVAVDLWFHFAYVYRAFVQFSLGDAAHARSDARTSIRLGGEDPLWGEAALAIAQARLGDTVRGPSAGRISCDERPSRRRGGRGCRLGRGRGARRDRGA